jgi:simple sugar transport system ATP-binding protein
MFRSQRPPDGPIVVQMKNVWKRFPGVVANRGVDLELRAGEVHALLGENGAGKTTLMNILAGLYRLDYGEIRLEGRGVSFRGPADAIEAGIGMVHQHFRLVDKLTVSENIHLGWKETPWRFSKALLTRRTRTIFGELGLNVDCDARIWQLSTGEQQRVEIARVLTRGARVLILDEPTSVLTPIEARELFRTIRSLADGGRTVVLITHKLDEVVDVSDRVSILRAGKRVATKPTVDCDQRLLAQLMVGEDVLLEQRRQTRTPGAIILELDEAEAEDDRGQVALKHITLCIREGEIVGVAGVAGNGQSELAEVLTGLRPIRRGIIRVHGQDLAGRSPIAFVRAGVGHIPEDRIGRGLVEGASVIDNAILREYRDPPISRGFRLDSQAAFQFTQKLVDEAGVRLPNLRLPVNHLSGGNQQRLLAKREIRVGSHLLVAVHPTRGLDIGATDEVRRSLIQHRGTGGAVLLISEDLDEVLSLSDRVVVMYAGQIVGEFTSSNADREEVGLLMGGSKAEGKAAI